MGWREDYEARLTTAEGAAALIQRGDTLFTPIGGDAWSVMPSIFGRILELDGQVKVRAVSASGAQEWFYPEFAHLDLDLNAGTFAGSVGRVALADQRADYYPDLFSNQFNVYDRSEPHEPIDVFATGCSAPDEEGYVHFGGLPWHKAEFIRRARTSILEVCPWMPDIRTTVRVHVSEVTAFVPTVLDARPPRGIPDPPAEAEAVAGFVSEIVQDGDTIQIGAGRTATFLVPLGMFDGKRDLGWHSEITPRGVVEKMMDGTINNSRKTVDRGVGVTTSVAVPTPEEEQWLVDSDALETRSVVEVNSITAIAAQERMCAINNAFTVDLTGQICAESLGTTVYNGSGGQPEFHIGAVIAPGGKAITVLPASALDGAVSRIVGRITDGAFVTVPRTFADYVVTEYGIARLAGKSQRQRAEELTSIAHPDHRGELRAAARAQYYPSSVSRSVLEAD